MCVLRSDHSGKEIKGNTVRVFLDHMFPCLLVVEVHRPAVQKMFISDLYKKVIKAAKCSKTSPGP